MLGQPTVPKQEDVHTVGGHVFAGRCETEPIADMRAITCSIVKWGLKAARTMLAR